MNKVPTRPGSDPNQVVDEKTLERLRRLGGNELVVKMIDLFSSHAQSVLTQALAAFEAEDLEALERAAHSIKSSAGNVGAIEVRHLAEQIEEAAHAGNRAVLQQLTTGLAEAFDEAKTRLDEQRNSTAG